MDSYTRGLRVKEIKQRLNEDYENRSPVLVFSQPEKQWKFFDDSQVISWDDIQVGELYIVHWGNRLSAFVCLELDLDDEERWFVGGLLFPFGPERLLSRYRLQELGLIKYPEGRYNQDNWLESTGVIYNNEELGLLKPPY